MTPFERKDMPWVIGAGVVLMLLIILIVAYYA